MISSARIGPANSKTNFFDASGIRATALVILFSTAAVVESRQLLSLSALSGGDIWWHLRTGLWILQNHSLPHNGIYSQAAEFGWSSTSWVYDVLLALRFRVLGLLGIPALLMVLKAGLAFLTWLLAGGLRGRFWTAVVLSVVAQYVLCAAPATPIYISILFFGLELLLLNGARRTGSIRPLYWLPIIFVLWANIDNQFVYGILLMLLLVASSLLQRDGSSRLLTTTSPAKLGTLMGVSLVGTFITPTFYRPYAEFFAAFASATRQYFPEFQAMNFRQPRDYVLMLLTMGAFLALGKRRSRDVFLLTLLGGATVLVFYSQRNSWLVTLASIGVIAECFQTGPVADEIAELQRHKRSVATAVAVTVLILIIATVRIPRQDELLLKMGKSYPVRASDYIRDHRLPQPLFNDYQWGGFLTWYLPEYPVAIDSRQGLYRDDEISQYCQVMKADLPYTAFPVMANSGTLLLQKDSLMGKALATLPPFQIAYSDEVAVVLVRRQSSE